jgi:hypothetical protein
LQKCEQIDPAPAFPESCQKDLRIVRKFEFVAVDSSDPDQAPAYSDILSANLHKIVSRDPKWLTPGLELVPARRLACTAVNGIQIALNSVGLHVAERRLP